jgi:hypothetical protein
VTALRIASTRCYWPAGDAVTAAMWDQRIVRQVAAPAVSAPAPRRVARCQVEVSARALASWHGRA